MRTQNFCGTATVETWCHTLLHFFYKHKFSISQILIHPKCKNIQSTPLYCKKCQAVAYRSFIGLCDSTASAAFACVILLKSHLNCNFTIILTWQYVTKCCLIYTNVHYMALHLSDSLFSSAYMQQSFHSWDITFVIALFPSYSSRRFIYCPVRNWLDK